jgi:hypothetical protein
MKKILLLATIVLMTGSAAMAIPIPDLQLYISGAQYDLQTLTWVTNSSSFDLYVVSAGHIDNDVIVSMSMAKSDMPSNANVNFDGRQIQLSDWVHGIPPICDDPNNLGFGDLAPVQTYPTWYTELHTGAYNQSEDVGAALPGPWFWNPATGQGPTFVTGMVKRFHILTGGTFSYLHFDAYSRSADGKIAHFAPFFSDATAAYAPVPEPNTLALLGTGILGLGASFRRKKK